MHIPDLGRCRRRVLALAEIEIQREDIRKRDDINASVHV